MFVAIAKLHSSPSKSHHHLPFDSKIKTLIFKLKLLGVMEF